MKRTSMGAALLAVGMCLCLAWSSSAQEEKGKKGPLTDQQFVLLASSSGLAEVNLGKLALKQAASEDVRKFARHMVDDHSKANKELNRLADSKRIPPAPAMDKKHRALMDKLATLKGEDFDHQYMKEMVKDHQEAVALFEREAKDGQDADLKAFASKTLPTLKDHLKMARKLAGTDDKHEDKGKDKHRSGDDKKGKDG